MPGAIRETSATEGGTLACSGDERDMLPETSDPLGIWKAWHRKGGRIMVVALV